MYDKVIIFDGVCGLCNKSVNFLIMLDKKQQFRYAPLQGEYVKKLNRDITTQSIIFYTNDIFYDKSTAILKILASLGGLWVGVKLFYLIPKPIRDALYDLIAKHRYRFLGKHDACRVPTKEEKKLFLE